MTESVGVIGAGVMGQGVALTLGQYGFRVILIDLNESILDKAKQNMNEQFYGYSFINENFDNENFMDNITFTTDYSHIKRRGLCCRKHSRDTGRKEKGI